MHICLLIPCNVQCKTITETFSMLISFNRPTTDAKPAHFPIPCPDGVSEIPDSVKEIGVFTQQPCYGVYKRLTRIPKTAASIRRRALAILMWGPRGLASYHRKYFTDADRRELRVSAVIDAFGGSLGERIESCNQVVHRRKLRFVQPRHTGNPLLSNIKKIQFLPVRAFTIFVQ